MVQSIRIRSGRKPKLPTDLEKDPNVKVSETFKEYYELLSKRLVHFQKLLFEFNMKKLFMLNKEIVLSI